MTGILNYVANKRKIYVASLSCGKDSLAMVLKLMELGRQLDYAIFYDTGMEFNCIYEILRKITPMLEAYGCKVVVLKPKHDFYYYMNNYTVNAGRVNAHDGYSWCGGPCRWMTSFKISAIHKFLSSLDGEVYQYIGIAQDEPHRMKQDKHVIYPLNELGMTESMCLSYCHHKGFFWNEHSPRMENGIVELYSILKRVSCFCCINKSLNELKYYYYYLPDYWNRLKEMQTKTSRPFRSDGRTIFELELEFQLQEFKKGECIVW